MKQTIQLIIAAASLSAVKAFEKETLTIDNQEVFSKIFAENHAEIISSGHIWTEGPAFSEKHETLYFSDVPKGHIWAYKNGEAKLIITNSGDKITMPAHDLKETTLAEPGSNGLSL